MKRDATVGLGLGSSLCVLGLFLSLGCTEGPPPPDGADYYDPSTDRPDAPMLPEMSDVTFDNLRYWKIENQPGWETRAVDVDIVSAPGGMGLALMMSFRDLGLDEHDSETNTGPKPEAAFSFVPPEDQPLDLKGKTRVRFELRHLEPDPLVLNLGISGAEWNWMDVPQQPMTVGQMERETVVFDIPNEAEGLHKTRRITFMLKRDGAPITGRIYVARIEVL